MKLTRVVNSIAFVNSKVFLSGVASTGAKDCALGQRVLELKKNLRTVRLSAYGPDL